MMATIIGVIIFKSPVAKEIPIPKPSKKLCKNDDKIFKYPAIPLPFKLAKHPLSFYSKTSVFFSDKRD